MPIFTSSLRPTNGIPSGKHGGIIQVESVKKTNTFVTSNDSFVDVSGLELTITPHSTSNKIMVCLSIAICGDFYTSFARIVRKQTGVSTVELFTGTGSGSRPISAVCTTGDNGIQDSHGQIFFVHRQFIDEPSTTSELTYLVQAQGRPDNSLNGATKINYSVPDRNTNTFDPRVASELMVMEVSG